MSHRGSGALFSLPLFHVILHSFLTGGTELICRVLPCLCQYAGRSVAHSRRRTAHPNSLRSVRLAAPPRLTLGLTLCGFELEFSSPAVSCPQPISTLPSHHSPPPNPLFSLPSSSSLGYMITQRFTPEQPKPWAYSLRHDSAVAKKNCCHAEFSLLMWLRALR